MKKIFLTLFIIWQYSSVSNAVNFGLALTPPSKLRPMLSYSGLIHKESDFPNGHASTSLQEADFSTPLYKTDLDALSLGIDGNQLNINPQQSGYSTLKELNFSLSYSRVIDAGRMWAVSTKYGSASDKLFNESSVTSFGITGFYSFANDESSRWLLLIDYSNDRPILNNLPLPGFAYFYNPSKDFRAILGAPFASFTWNFKPNMSMDISTIVPWVFKGTLNYHFDEHTKVSTGFNFSQLTYSLAGRKNTDERLFYDEKKIFIGAKSPLSKSVVAELEVGTAFDRSLFLDESYQLNPNNPIRISNGNYLKAWFLFLL